MSTRFINTSHGVLYTPSSVGHWGAPSIQELRGSGTKYIRVQWVDLTNSVRCRIVPITQFIKLMKSSRPGIATANAALGIVDLSMADGFGAAGEGLYVPDLSTARICPYAPRHASVLGWFEEKTPYKGSDGEMTVKSDMCPRTKLQNVVQEAKKEGIEFLVGFESEFVLLRSTDPVQTANVHQWCATKGLLSGSVEAEVLEEIVDSLIASGIQVDLYHPEAAPGQYEVVTGPLQPLEAADALIHTRETIMHIAAKHNLHATFAPRVTMTSAGNGTHTNISVHSPSHRKTADILSDLESSFLAGVLDELHALPGLTLPTPASYKRVGDNLWSGGTHIAWGTENRECPIRLTNMTSPGSRRFELRFVDATANPHLALAGILGVGLAGIKAKRQLKIKDASIGIAGPSALSEEERRALGIERRMPLSWEEGRKNLSQSDILRSIFGEVFLTKYLAVNKTLAEVLRVDDEGEALTRLVRFF